MYVDLHSLRYPFPVQSPPKTFREKHSLTISIPMWTEILYYRRFVLDWDDLGVGWRGMEDNSEVSAFETRKWGVGGLMGMEMGVVISHDSPSG